MSVAILKIKTGENTWVEIPAITGEKGEQGVGIDTVVFKNRKGSVSTYAFELTDGRELEFEVTNGNIITEIKKIATDTLLDTYRISLDDGSHHDFNVTNGRGIDYIEKAETTGLVDKYVIHYNDNTTSSYNVVNGEAGPAGSIGNRIYDSGLVDKINDELGYNKVVELKHSTFDRSKFTAVGTPTITDDGIASGFSKGNNIHIDVALTSNNRVKITDKFTYTTQYVAGAGKQIYVSGNKQLRLFLQERVGLAYAGSLLFNVSYKINVGDTIYYEYIIDNLSEHSLRIWQNDVLIVDKTSKTVANFDVTPYYIGASNWGDYALYSSIDLKQLSITVDGKEVFNGNKTGMNIIKPDNYIVVGNPTISEDGIASGFSSNNYVRLQPLTYLTTSTVTAKGRFTVDEVSASKARQFFNLGNFRGEISVNNEIVIFPTKGLTGGTLLTPTNIVKSGDVVEYETTVDQQNLKITLKVRVNGGEEQVFSKGAIGTPTGLINYSGLIGGGSYPFIGGSIDLNSFKIYVDGNLVYQPCLKIPYTQSKTGSKIVNSIYLPRVQDCYDQTGLGEYYTLDETNEKFSLPLQDIYGIMQNKVDKHGGTITGPLTIISPDVPLRLRHRNMQRGVKPNANQFNTQLFNDKNGDLMGFVQQEQYTTGLTQMVMSDAYLKENGTYDYSYLSAGHDADGNPYTYATHPTSKVDNSNNIATTNWVRNHCCTTAATTESTASLDAPCYIIENYVNGTSWYRVHSDGWIEQGAYSTNKTNSQTVVFFKPFREIPTLTTTIVTQRNSSSFDGEIFVRSVSSSDFVFGARLDNCSGWSWHACGY